MALNKLLLDIEIILVDGCGFVDKPSAPFRYQDSPVNLIFSYRTEISFISIRHKIH